MIVTTTEQIQTALAITKGYSFDKIKPFITRAEYDIKSLIGEAFYDELDSYINAEPFTEDKTQQAVIDRLQVIIANWAFYYGFNVLNTQFSNTGMHRIENENKKPLFQRQEVALKNNFKEAAEQLTDELLEFLEKNATNYSTWTNSEAYTLLKRNYINSTNKFNEIYNIGNSRSLFLKLRSMQNIIEDLQVVPVIGKDLHKAMKTAIKADNLTTEQKNLLPYIQKAVAHYTIAQGGIRIAAEISSRGFYHTELDSSGDNPTQKSKEKGDLLTRILTEARETGDAYARSLKQFLENNLSDYPLYENSEAYNPDVGSWDTFSTENGKITML